MNKITILALAAMATMSFSSAFGQGMGRKPMMGHKPMMSHSMPMDKTSMAMMMSLSPAEKKIAGHMMMMMDKRETMAMKMAGKNAMMAGRKGMKLSMNDAKMHAQLMKGMDRSEKMHMMSGMKKMTPAEVDVAKKMMMSANRAGMMKRGHM